MALRGNPVVDDNETIVWLSVAALIEAGTTIEAMTDGIWLNDQLNSSYRIYNGRNVAVVVVVVVMVDFSYKNQIVRLKCGR